MKILKLLIGLMLVSVPALSAGNVEIHFNYPSDTIFIGGPNTMEIWIGNDEVIQGLTLAFEISGYDGTFIWNETYGSDPPFGRHNRGEYSLYLETDSNFLDDQVLPDTVFLGGFHMPDKTALPTGPTELCYSLQFEIPAGQSVGNLCINNIYLYPAGDWVFCPENGTDYPPDYFNCVNQSPLNPDCNAVCFPIEERPAPVADFAFAPDSGDIPLQVQFLDLSLNQPESWLWYFGDGQTSMEQSPLHEYTAVGTYFPKLVVSNASGSDSLTSPDPIIVTEPQPEPGVFITCPALQETYSASTDTVSFHVELIGTSSHNFSMNVNDNSGWFISPTFIQFGLDPGSDTTINVAVLVPEEVPYGSENPITATVTSQSDPQTTDTESCVLRVVSFICGDINLDGNINISDALYLINHIFLNGPAPCEPGE
ncbi:MAG: PKD domain-containing protein [Aliifodinibius sp.]|nr:PKD domain-containing protein [candidate division Zixibacteria bacterium]NIT59241.1 PKD domain-containing protein [Fodinibius sp.]NIW40502.1 PKD domain-containing protein [candidate division Zixibacteria bacterium]NIX57825.1 PKD domain-containing protein [candidate division Zixibacteria bacterium]NIY27824.1 PKD domain-containing protein [Fodinibius sp.]